MTAPMDKANQEALRNELVGLLSYINRVREEIAKMSRPADEDHQFETMSEQLDAVVKTTDEASNTIMENAEKNETLVNDLRKEVTDPKIAAVLDKISANDMDIIQACSFQDLTGQRVTKVARSLTYVEDRVNALAEVWGKEELEKVEIAVSEKSDDEKLLHGPALPSNTSISQDEIDALFD
ncbi:MAG: protein phosphatase CheZ [Rhodospirillaceae bacterium]|nr:protein phosphatase CheZ [Rhodospirillaceae bacterium]